jgi:hypothetical protein
MPLDKQNFNYSIPLSAPLLSADNGVIVGDNASSALISNGKILYSLNGTTYIPVGISTVVANSVSYSPTAPTNPSVGQMWVDSTSNNTNYDPNLIRRKTIVATGGQTAFTADLAFTDGYEQVFLNGLLLTRNVDYTTVNSIQVNLVVAAVVNDVIDILSITNLNSVGAAGALTTSNTFTGAQTFTPSSAAITPITVNGAFNQTADLANIKNYNGTNLFTLDSLGRIVVGNTTVGQNQNYLTIQNTTSTGMYPWEASGLAIRDSRSLSASVGGGIIFEGNYLNTASGIAAFSGIKGTKFNTTSGDVKGFLDLWSRGGGIRMYTSEQVVGSESINPAIQIGVAGDTYLKGYNPSVSFTMSAYNDTSKQQIIMADNEQMKFYSLSPNVPAFFWLTGNATGGTAGATQSVSINPSGLGIGGANASGTTRLSIYGSDASNPIQAVLQNGNAGGSRYLILNSGGSSAGSFAWDNNNSRLSLDSLTTAPLLFRTNNLTAVLIDTSQNMLVGYTSSNGAYKLQVNSQIFATSTSIATSDAKFKKNVKEITGGLDMIDSLRPVQFDWKKNKTHNFVEGKTVGFIAQEVREAFKDQDWVGNLVKSNYNEETEEEFLGLAESNIIPLLVSAVKELRAEVKELRGMIK